MTADSNTGIDLLCDVGNSRIKWACARAGVIEQHGVADSPADLLSQLGQCPVARLAVAATGDEQRTAALLRQLAQRWPAAAVHRARTAARCGALTNSYAEPERMGVDRWLAMIAAWQSTRSSFCVIDAGTALTVDVADDNGRHLGGWIAPGLGMMREALTARTARIGSDLAPSPGRWGRSTGEAVYGGIHAALRGTVAQALAQLRRDNPGAVVFLTGGDLAFLVEQLESESISLSIEPLLVLQGLQHDLNGDDPAACSPD